jgi:hypothetical protein
MRVSMVAAGLLLPVLAAAQQNGSENARNVQIPTLGGIGLGALVGVLAMAGAWAVSRNRKNR